MADLPPTLSAPHLFPQPRHRRWFPAAAGVFFLAMAGGAGAVWLWNWNPQPGGKPEDSGSGGDRFDTARNSRRARAVVPEGGELSLRRRIETLTGAHTRIVWLQDTGEGRDAYALGTRLRLMGLDTRDPAGRRPLTAITGNFSRPLLTPDGTGIVCSVKTAASPGDDTVWSTAVHLAGWDGAPPVRLREGYAVDCWQDPQTSIVWVYAFTTLRPGRSPNPDGYRLIRFPLTDPERVEMVWEHGQLTGDNIQLNRSGTRASGLVPWPNAGCFDFVSGQFIRYREGCWPSLAPDDSGVAWVFDGSHKGLRLFIPGRGSTWRVSLGGADGMGKKAAYHPRWSNHPRFITFSGPYPDNRIDGAGKAIDILVARFSSDLTRIESSVKLRHDGPGSDYYPDLWIAGGAACSLDPASAGPQGLRQDLPGPAPVADWVPQPEQLLFSWSRASTPGRISSSPAPRECSVSPRYRARTGPRFSMLADGGHFVMDAVSSRAVRQAVEKGVWSLELALTPLRAAPPEAGPSAIFQAGPGLELHQFGADLLVACGGKFWIAGAGLTPGQTTHAVISRHGPDTTPAVWLNGRAQEIRSAESPWPAVSAGQGEPSASGHPSGVLPVTFGGFPDNSSLWTGFLETVSLHAAPAAESTARAHADWWTRQLSASPRPVPTVVRARLVEASPRTPPSRLGTYTRSWTSARYEKLELLSGPDPGIGFAAAHWTVLDLQELSGLSLVPGTEVTLTLEPMALHPELDSEHGSEEVLGEGEAFFLDMRLLGPPSASRHRAD